MAEYKYIHKWDSKKGPLFLFSNESNIGGSVPLSAGGGYVGVATQAKERKAEAILGNIKFTKEKEKGLSEKKIEPGLNRTATVANILRNFAQGLEEK
jgi:hypothetical protein